MCMYVLMVGFTVAPLLKTCFTMSESCPTQRASSTLAFSLGKLCTDAPFAASSSDRASWCSNVVYCWRDWHRSILTTGSVLPVCVTVAADNRSQLSVNDGRRVKIVPCKWCLNVPSRLVLARGIRSRRRWVV